MQVRDLADTQTGLKSVLTLECSDHSNSFATSINAINQGKSQDINRRAVYYSIESGCGYEGLASLCSVFNMPCISKPAYYKQLETIMGTLEEEARKEMKEAGQRLRKVILAENPEMADDEILDVAVGFDGTWKKRGFTSLTGVVFVISIDTGEVLDYYVLSKVCQKCALKKSTLSDGQIEEWLLEHECDINYVGSSLAMETEGAVVLWQRSVETGQ